MNIAIVGSGIAGMTAAYLLHKHHDICLFESEDRLGGHTATVDVSCGGKSWQIDTGFIVFNDWTYPGFIRLMEEIGVSSRASDMSFSVSCKRTGLEFAGLDGTLAMLNGLFAQRRNLLSPAYINMLLDIVRFNRIACADVENGTIPLQMTLSDYLRENALGDMLRDFYLIPMGSAIWSTARQQMADFPVSFMLPFMYRHGLLSVNKRPVWRTINGGSSAYIKPPTAGFKDRIRISTPVHAISRQTEQVVLRSSYGEEIFDQVIIACHSDQALALLTDSSALEHKVLGSIRYQPNEVVLHTDSRQLPLNRRAWASWNYILDDDAAALPKLTYDMNRLMGIQAHERFCVTLNNTVAIAPEKILRRFNYAHPIFTQAGADAQQSWAEINGVNRTWFCGAYWGKGFHEDAVHSAIQTAKALGVDW